MALRVRIDLRGIDRVFPVEAQIEDGVCIRIQTLKDDLPQRDSSLERALQDAIDGRTPKVEYPCDSSQLTPLQARIFEYMDREIPRGKTITYGELAKALRTSPRGVASALAHNPLPLFYPCHRVVASQGSGGYSLAGIELKLALLESEMDR